MDKAKKLSKTIKGVRRGCKKRTYQINQENINKLTSLSSRLKIQAKPNCCLDDLVNEALPLLFEKYGE